MKNCLVLGSGRSGTSMLAGILDKSGYNTGDNYIKTRDANPAGFYEDRSVNQVNDALMRSVVGRRSRITPAWLAPHRPRAHTWAVALDAPNIRRGPDTDAVIRDLVSRQPFAYKDPRLSYTLPVWEPHLPDGTVKLCIFREPGRTATSIVREFDTARYLRREPMTIRRALKAWTAMYRSVLEHCEGDPDWRFVHYDQLIDGTAIPRLEEKLETPLDASHVDPALRRSQDPAGDLPDETVRVYRTLCWAAMHPSYSG